MSIKNFQGKTFVAFTDISGFKELMKTEKKAWKALDRLYQYGYDILRYQKNNYRVEGIFISDSGIMFIRQVNQNLLNFTESLKLLLEKLKEINKRMRENDFMLDTSVAYGNFKYQERIEFEGIEKNPIYGDAYVSAFLDNENGKPKIQPGQCRIIKKNLPEKLLQNIRKNNNDDTLRMVKERKIDDKHYYFYWMVNKPEEIDEFEKQYTDACNLKYEGILKALKCYK